MQLDLKILVSYFFSFGNLKEALEAPCCMGYNIMGEFSYFKLLFLWIVCSNEMRGEIRSRVSELKKVKPSKMYCLVSSQNYHNLTKMSV